jgi:hypothetical protein
LRALAAAALGGMGIAAAAASCTSSVAGGGNSGTTSSSAGGTGGTGPSGSTGGTTAHGGTGGTINTGGHGGTGGGPDVFPRPIGPRSPKVKWTLSLPTEPMDAPFSPSIGPDGTLYLPVKNNLDGDSLAAIHPDGTVKWKVGPGTPTEQDLAAPIVGKGGVLYTWAVGAGDPLIARSTADGHVLWTAPQYFDLAALAPNGTIVGTSGGELVAVSHTGAPLWTKALSDPFATTFAIAPEGTLYIGTNTEPAADVYAFHPDGSEAWRVPLPDEGGANGALVGPDGTVYIGGRRSLHAYSPSGALLWTTTFAKVYDGRVFPVGARADGFLLGYDMTGFYGLTHAGRVTWGVHAETFGGGDFDAEGTLYLATRDELQAIRADGTRAWTFPHTGGVTLGPDGTLYLFGNGTLYALADPGEPDAGAPDGGTGGGGGGVDLGACGSTALWSADLARDGTAAPWKLADLAVGATGHAFVGLLHVGGGPGAGAAQIVEIDAAGSVVDTRTFTDAVLDQADSTAHMTLDTHGARSPTAQVLFAAHGKSTLHALLAPGIQDLDLNPISVDPPVGNAAGDVFGSLGYWSQKAVVRWDASGTEIWAKSAGGWAIVAGADDGGNLYLSEDGYGNYDYGCGASTSARLIKFGPTGLCLWQHQVPKMTSAARLFAADAASDLYLVDANPLGIDLGCGALPAGGTAYAARVTPAGTCVWQRRLVGTNVGAARFPAGGVLLSTTFPYYQTADLGGGPVASFSSGNIAAKTPSDVLLTRLDASGAVAWMRHFGAAMTTLALDRAFIDATGAVLLVGTSDGPVDFGGGPLDPAGGRFLVKLDGAGTFLSQSVQPAGAMIAPDPCGAPILATPTATGFHVTRLAP